MQPPKRASGPRTILLVDDHHVVRQGLHLIVERVLPGCKIGAAATAAEALAMLAAGPWDLVVLDLNLPDSDGFDLLRTIKTRFQTRVLVLSVYPEHPFAARAIRAGADGYVSKSSLETDLTAALRAVAAGRRYVTQQLAADLADVLAGKTVLLPHERLSQREYEVLRALAAGRTVTEIAASLKVSSKTISTYRSRILTKMGLRSNADLIRYAVENHLLL